MKVCVAVGKKPEPLPHLNRIRGEDRLQQFIIVGFPRHQVYHSNLIGRFHLLGDEASRQDVIRLGQQVKNGGHIQNLRT